MAFYSWLIPVFVVFFLGIAGFYFVVRLTGGKGMRTDGRTVLDKPVVEDEQGPS